MREYSFAFGRGISRVFVREQTPSLEALLGETGAPQALLVCDSSVEYLARKVLGPRSYPLCVLESGEAVKNWASVERILEAAFRAGLGRDGLFLGMGGGVITDLASFAASIYMRGARLCLVATSLLGMVDAALGGKTGFDLLGMKNLAGTFYPAERVYMPLEALKTLPPEQWRSGMAEILKTAVLEGPGGIKRAKTLLSPGKSKPGEGPFLDPPALEEIIGRCLEVKGRIVEADPREAPGGARALLNLGHSFGHALEAALGLGTLSHGEAVAWGLVRASELGLALGITPEDLAGDIRELALAWGFETASPHPLLGDPESFMRALWGDKKKSAGTPVFVVPNAGGAELVSAASLPRGLLEKLIF